MTTSLQWLNIIGLAAGFVGTAMVALAIGKSTAFGGYYSDPDTPRLDFAMVNRPGAFKLGLALLALGFALQCGAAVYPVLWG